MWGVMISMLFSFMLLKVKYFYWLFMMLYSLCLLISLKYSSFWWIKYYSYYFQLDKTNFVFMFLSLIMLLMMVLLNNKKTYKFCFYMLVLILIMFFCSKNLLFLYFFFELSLVPMLFMIVQWGLKPERLNASFYMAIYTLLGSMPLLVGVLMLYKISKETIFMEFMKGQFSVSSFDEMSMIKGCKKWICSFMFFMNSYWFLVMMSLGFLIKLPLFGLHLWLTKAHVEATTEGSMMLASVLLKLGVFGMLRVSEMYLMKSYQLSLILVWAALSLLVVSLICFRKVDLKLLVAYSSVVHMGVLVLVFYSNLQLSKSSCLMVSIAHGMTSSLMFYMVGNIYLLSGSRSLTMKKAFSVMKPLIIYCWIGALMFNMKFPPSMKFFGEVYSFMFMKNFNSWLMWLVLLTVFFGGLFKMYVFMALSHGKRSQNFSKNLNKKKFFFMMMAHLVLKVMVLSWWVWF